MSPKQEFQKSPAKEGFQDLVDSSKVQTALNASMLEFHSQILLAPDMATAAANEWRRQGAKRFREIFEGLARNPTPDEKRTDKGNLDHSIQ